MAAIAWHDRFEEAGSPDEMVHAIREYVMSLDGDAKCRVPTHCRIDRIVHDDDFDGVTWRLSDAARAKRDDFELNDIFGHFLHASLRVSQMRRAQSQQVMAGMPRRSSQQMR